MTTPLYPPPGGRLARRRKELAPRQEEAFVKVKQFIAIAHATQCPYCIRGHTTAARRAGATPEEIVEAIWVAAEMRAGAAYAHSLLALDAIDKEDGTD